jgi:predicted nucleic acid-binding Zn ribbon protein
MTPGHQLLQGVLADLLRQQPLSAAKVSLAWRAVAGAAVARATRVELREDGTLIVLVGDPRWRPEIERAAGMLRPKLATLLGDPFKWIEVRESPRDRHEE